MTVASEAAEQHDAAQVNVAEVKAREHRAIGVASGAHALHDGYTDLIYVMLPIWQSEFGIGYAALGLLRTCYSGTMAGLQIPSALLSERLGVPLVLAIGTALSGLGYLIAGTSSGFVMLVIALLIGGLGSSTQHPLASALVARAFAGPRSLKALGTYNFAGDIGKMSVPALASLLLVVMAWRPVVAILGFAGLAAAVVIYALTPKTVAEAPAASKSDDKTEVSAPASRSRAGFWLLLAIGMVDSATRMGLLIFLPFILIGKGAALPTIGLALTLIFAGGAVGKLVCAFIGARLGVIGTVCLTEGLTTAGILALLPLPLEAAMVLLPLIGVMLNGTSSVLYGSVPELVEPDKRTRMFGIFYTGTIGSGAVSPALYGLVGDAFGVPMAICVVAALCLLTLPLALLLRPALPQSAR
ncbi:MFS transporter [Rhodoplanes sp. Z2-YC6860]|uniref:MFS transporter n=1 Tax=Rhodoplanes sp. Z2-YC6860 TaxID=674703 RepID=UPI00078B46E6|nr:MFS transporter [Rhodoplanes sp. Z2-YC6860]AMN39960.1 Fosmidomycin resistance protein [Rhodoplanes sp. Z2-YC6860]